MPTSLTLTPAEQALAIEDIKRTFAGRLRCMDTKQWSLYASFHTEDVVSETWDGLPAGKRPVSDGVDNRVVGNQRLAAMIESVLDGDRSITSVHHGHAPEIELTSDTTASGVWPMEDRLWWSHDGVEESLHGYGHYHEEYRKVGDRWLISYRKLTRLRVDMTPGFHA